ncbi:DNA ligase [Candidatus Pacearchaeota archaeon]|nr:DNA ligase [Candidatus Pacearchaeota archaeon]
MRYSELSDMYQELEDNSSRLRKTEILSNFLKKLNGGESIYLLQGKAFPDYSEKEFGISERLCIKALSKASGIVGDRIIDDWKKIGDLGEVAEKVIGKKKQNTLFSKSLSVRKVLDNLRKLPELEGKGTIGRKLSLISELLTSASGKEAKYIIRTLIGDLRIGVASGTIRDAIVQTYSNSDEKKEVSGIVQEAYDKTNDFALIFEKMRKGIDELKKIQLNPGHPIKLMLALKADNLEDGFKRVGRPAAFEYKYDGFRMLINKDKKGKVKIFTRRLDNVTNQFPDVAGYIRDHIKADSFIIDSEAIGYDPKSLKYRPFEAISQRIKRKHNIEKLVKELPIEVNVFDILYLNGKSLIGEPFEKRTKIMRDLIKPYKHKIRCSHQLITSDEKKAEKFYKDALKDNQEGLMIKNLHSRYVPGARVGHMLKLKPAENELDLVITGGEYGKGKRAGILSSFTLSCRDEGKFLEIGKASTGLKEKEELGLSFKELNDRLRRFIVKESGRGAVIKPKIIVTIIYQNIQRSPTYKSGFALRFPRIVRLRDDKGLNDVASLKEISDDYVRHELKVHY